MWPLAGARKENGMTKREVQQSIAEMEEARRIHQQWVEFQGKRRMGGKAWHLAWVKRYDAVIEILRVTRDVVAR